MTRFAATTLPPLISDSDGKGTGAITIEVSPALAVAARAMDDEAKERAAEACAAAVRGAVEQAAARLAAKLDILRAAAEVEDVEAGGDGASGTPAGGPPTEPTPPPAPSSPPAGRSPAVAPTDAKRRRSSPRTSPTVEAMVPMVIAALRELGRSSPTAISRHLGFSAKSRADNQMREVLAIAMADGAVMQDGQIRGHPAYALSRATPAPTTPPPPPLPQSPTPRRAPAVSPRVQREVAREAAKPPANGSTQPPTLTGRLLALLQSGEFDVPTMAQRLSCQPSEAAHALARLKANGENVEKVSPGRYRCVI